MCVLRQARARDNHAPLPPLLEERDTCSSGDDGNPGLPDVHWTNCHPPHPAPGPDLGPGPGPGPAVWSGRPQSDRDGRLLAAAVEEAVRRALSGSAAVDVGPLAAPGPAPATAVTTAGPARDPVPADRPDRRGRGESQRQQGSRRWTTNISRRDMTSRTGDQSNNRNNGDDGEHTDYADSRDIEHIGDNGTDGPDGGTEDGGRQKTAGLDRQDEELLGGRSGPLSGRGRQKEGRGRSEEGEGDRADTGRRRSDRSRHRRKGVSGAAKVRPRRPSLAHLPPLPLRFPITTH